MVSSPPPGTGIGVPAVLVAVLIGRTESPGPVTYRVLPSGLSTRTRGLSPVWIGVSAVPVAVSIGVTECDPAFATYRVLPSGVMARASGAFPTVIGARAVLVAIRI